MARSRCLTPSYLKHKATGRGRLVWTDATGARREKLLPGKYNSRESREAKARLELELATSPMTSTRPDISVMELLAAYLDFANRYYVDDDGKPTTEVTGIIVYAMKPVRELYGKLPATQFGPVALRTVRQAMIAADLSRGVINHRINVIRRIFRWAASEELVPVSVFEALRTLPGLRRGRTEARESDPVKPVDDATVDATLPYLSPHVRAMVELMRHTGMRPSEVCAMTLGQLERGTHWYYRPLHHKTAYNGKSRIIPFGPRAREVLAGFLDCRILDPDEPIFSPRREREERFAMKREQRKSPVQPSQICRRKEQPEKVPTERYTSGAIAHAVVQACLKVNAPPAALVRSRGESYRQWRDRLTEEEKEQLREHRRKHTWHPYQLRHAFATKVRKAHGLEAAQVLLGHATADVTQVYAERDLTLASAVAAKIG